MGESEEGTCLIEMVSRRRFAGLPFMVPKHELRTNEASLMRDVLHMVQGHPSRSFFWEDSRQAFYLREGIHLSHLSRSSLAKLLGRFTDAASSLRRIDSFVKRVAKASCVIAPSHSQASPTLQAFASTLSIRLEHLRRAALENELLAVSGGAGTTITLLGLLSSLSWVCVGSKFLEQIVSEAIPQKDFLDDNVLPAGELGAQILSYLFHKLSEYCLLHDGEEEPYGTLLMLFAGTLQPMTESLDAWLHEGFLDDPFGELFFYANKSVAIEDAAFWQKGFCLRYRKPVNDTSGTQGKEDLKVESTCQDSMSLVLSPSHSQKLAKTVDLRSKKNKLSCPNFLQHVAHSVLSAGKSLQLLQHVHRETAGDISDEELALSTFSIVPSVSGFQSSYHKLCGHRRNSQREELALRPYILGRNDRTVFGSLWHQWSLHSFGCGRTTSSVLGERKTNLPCVSEPVEKSGEETAARCSFVEQCVPFVPPSNIQDSKIHRYSMCASLSNDLPPLSDEEIHKAIFGQADRPSALESSSKSVSGHVENMNNGLQPFNSSNGTDYSKGSSCGNLLATHARVDARAMERLFLLPTALPSSERWSFISSQPQDQTGTRLSAVMYQCLQKPKLCVTPLPQILVQECLLKSILTQVEGVGRQVLDKLMGEWRLMEELYILRAVYLIGSGDLLQQFSSVLFNKLDRGEPWDDFYELNTMLQESVRSSADGGLLPALDSLVVTVQNKSNSEGPGPTPLQLSGRNLAFGIDILDNLVFMYKVAWPLELIIDSNAIKKYNQVMAFLFKVKRAKFALDKACRWMWKGGGGDAMDLKQQLLLQQKLMHFVNTLHQYVMDRVLYSAWEDLCQGMATASSLDEVIACHDAYLVSIQRQCLVAPDKLWALISSRVKTILSLALDFFSIQRTLCGGGAAPAIKARCQMEIERVGRQFDECIVFLLRVLSFKLNVGHFPHLAELVTRINYNFYYISESGHLLTPLPEVTNRKGSQPPKLSSGDHRG